MESKQTIFVTKDIVCKKYLSRYASLIHTPNIDSLFISHIDNMIMAAASTAMSWLTMFSGCHLFEVDTKEDEMKMVMDVYKEQGKKCAIVLGDISRPFFEKSELISRSSDVTFINGVTGRCTVGLKPFKDAVEKCGNYDFIWIHLPHFFFDMDVCISEGTVDKKEVANYQKLGHISESFLITDKFMMWIKKTFPDARIIFTGDHGETQGENNHYWYTNYFDEEIINLPFADVNAGYNYTTQKISSTNIKNIILGKPIEFTKYIMSENRRVESKSKKLMLLNDNWKYIYNSKVHSEKLFNLDINESFNFLHLVRNDLYFDPYKSHLFSYKKLIAFKDIDLVVNELVEFRKLKHYWITQEFHILKEGLKNGIQ